MAQAVAVAQVQLVVMVVLDFVEMAVRALALV
jgi:hypothetical protein